MLNSTELNKAVIQLASLMATPKFANNLRTSYIDDIKNVSNYDLMYLEAHYAEPELEYLLISYVALKAAKGKKAKLSKFVKKMVK